MHDLKDFFGSLFISSVLNGIIKNCLMFKCYFVMFVLMARCHWGMYLIEGLDCPKSHVSRGAAFSSQPKGQKSKNV